MDFVLLLGRLLLAGVFAIAGIAKLMDREGSRDALVGFGLPARIARPGAVLLPLAELAVALALLPLATAWWGGIGALGLLGLFVVGIGLSMARGEAPDCHCFGQLHSEPAGWRTLIRNGALALVAVFVVVAGGSEPGASLTGWLGDLSTAEQIGLAAITVTAALLAAQTWFLFQLMAQNGRLLTRVEQLEAGGPLSLERQAQGPTQPNLPDVGLPVGSPAPPFSLSGLYGETITLDAVLAPGKPALLLFTDPKCAPCNALLPEVARWQREHAESMTTVVISRREVAENLSKAREHGISTVLVQQNLEVYEAYQSRGTPSAVLVRPDGTIGSRVAGGARQIEQLVDWVLQAASEPAPGQPAVAPPSNGTRPSPAVDRRTQPAAPLTAMVAGGQPAPRIVLPDAAGNMVDLSDRGGRATVVLFWNPGCGFCKRMVDDLIAWESTRPDGAPDLVMISSGGVDDERVMALDVPYLLDDGFTASRQLGASGTPSAVLLGGDGRVASNVMVGADNVMGLLDPTRRVAAPNGNGVQPPLAPLVRMGSPVPDFELSDLDGNAVTSSALIGEETLVIFWDPACGFCQRMTDDLRALQADDNTPRMFVVSTGAVRANRELGLGATIVLDHGFDLGRRFGASGTPSAVLVDHKGRIVSTVAAGAPAILDLARSTSSNASA